MDICSPSGSKPFCFGALEFQARAGLDRSGRSSSVNKSWKAVKQHGLNANMIVEVFQVPEGVTAQATCVCNAGAVCAEKGMLWAWQRDATWRNPVTPPQRVMSACCTSTAPAASIL